MRKKINDLVIVPKKENLIKYCINNTPDIKHIKNDYETIRKKVLDNNENNINKFDIENKSKNVINKKIIDFKII